jgi:hypothetical protein
MNRILTITILLLGLNLAMAEWPQDLNNQLNSKASTNQLQSATNNFGNSVAVNLTNAANLFNGTLSNNAGEIVISGTETYGTAKLHIQNRNGSAGALFENLGLNLVDLGFLPNGGNQSNLRLECRTNYTFMATNTTGEFQFIMNSTSVIFIPFVVGKYGASFYVPITGNGSGLTNIPPTALSVGWTGIVTNWQSTTYSNRVYYYNGIVTNVTRP